MCSLMVINWTHSNLQEELDREIPSPCTFFSIALISSVLRLTLCVKIRDGIQSRFPRMVQASPMCSLQMISCFLQKLIPRIVKLEDGVVC